MDKIKNTPEYRNFMTALSELFNARQGITLDNVDEFMGFAWRYVAIADSCPGCRTSDDTYVVMDPRWPLQVNVVDTPQGSRLLAQYECHHCGRHYTTDWSVDMANSPQSAAMRIF